MTDALLPAVAAPRETAAPEPPAYRSEAPWRRQLAMFMESPSAVVGLALLVSIALLALLAPVISPQNPYDLAKLDIMDGTLPPGTRTGEGFTAYLGTDEQGRDMLSAIIYGLRISLGVGLVSVLFAAIVGT